MVRLRVLGFRISATSYCQFSSTPQIISVFLSISASVCASVALKVSSFLVFKWLPAVGFPYVRNSHAPFLSRQWIHSHPYSTVCIPDSEYGWVRRAAVSKKQKEPDLYPRFYEYFIADWACLFLVSRCGWGFVIFQLIWVLFRRASLCFS